MYLDQTIHGFLERQAGADFASRRYLLAVSGGLDSMVLLTLACQILEPSQICVAHYQHGLRGQDAQDDARLVQEQAGSRGLRFQLARRPFSAKKDEASLRNDRHRFLEESRTALGCDFILTAHHLNDQLETTLMRLVRGTGVQGLGGILPVRGVWLRPLLGVSRRQLQGFAATQGIPYREDATNLDTSYFRNRIRHELTPVLLGLSEPFGGDDAFLRRFHALTDEIQAFQSEISQQGLELVQGLVTSTPFWIRWERKAFQGLSPFWKKQVLRTVLKGERVNTLARPDLDRVLSLLDSNEKSADFPGFRLFQSCGYVYLQTPVQVQNFTHPIQLTADNAQIVIPSLHLRMTVNQEDRLLKQTQIRFFQPGDRLGNRKLKEVFLEHRIPRPERSLIPLFALPKSQDVLWIFPQPNSHIQIRCADFPYAASLKSLWNFISP